MSASAIKVLNAGDAEMNRQGMEDLFYFLILENWDLTSKNHSANYPILSLQMVVIDMKYVLGFSLWVPKSYRMHLAILDHALFSVV